MITILLVVIALSLMTTSPMLAGLVMAGAFVWVRFVPDNEDIIAGVFCWAALIGIALTMFL